MAIATDNFLLFPPERVPERRSTYLAKSSYSIFLLIAYFLKLLDNDLRS